MFEVFGILALLVIAAVVAALVTAVSGSVAAGNVAALLTVVLTIAYFVNNHLEAKARGRNFAPSSGKEYSPRQLERLSRERDERLFQMLRDADTFEIAKYVYDHAEDGSEIKSLAWAKMQKLI